MREIERAKIVDNDEWVYGYYLYVEEQNKHYILTGKLKKYPVDYVHPALTAQGFEWFEVKEETVGQCVGLKDKNGKEIYKGDIVKCSSLYGEDHICCSVEFCEFEGDEYTLHVKSNGMKKLLHSIYKYQYEVIGNIWDNPELLKTEVIKLTPYFTPPDMELVKKVTREVFLKDRNENKNVKND